MQNVTVCPIADWNNDKYDRNISQPVSHAADYHVFITIIDGLTLTRRTVSHAHGWRRCSVLKDDVVKRLNWSTCWRRRLSCPSPLWLLDLHWLGSRCRPHRCSWKLSGLLHRVGSPWRNGCGRQATYPKPSVSSWRWTHRGRDCAFPSVYNLTNTIMPLSCVFHIGL